MWIFFRIVFFSTLSLAATLGPPKLLEEPPNEVWFQKSQPDGTASPVKLKCTASANAEEFVWLKDGLELEIGGEDVDGGVTWERPGQNGSIVISTPTDNNQGYYQCFVSNPFGTAVSNKVYVRMGVLEHFARRGVRVVRVDEGAPLTLNCTPPMGRPKPTIFWLYRDTNREDVIETIKRRHIGIDAEGRLHFTAVQKEDGRRGLLYECAASSPVLRGEYRSGERVRLEVNERQILSVPIRTLYSTPDEVTVKTGERLKLQCIFGGRPRPVVFWEREDGELPKDRMKDLSSGESDFGMALVIDHVIPQDAGIYLCRAQHLQHVFNVKVHAAPFWDEKPPLDLTSSEDSEAELRCIAGGSPIPVVSWFLNGRPLSGPQSEYDDDPRRQFFQGGRIMRITNLKQDIDTGVYQCNASSSLGYVYSNVFINVKAHAPHFLMPSKREWSVVIRSNIDLDCQVDAAPTADVHWVDEDDRPVIPVEPRVTILPNHTLRILDVHTADEGLYYCNVSNKYGINRATNRLQVYKPTYFVKVPEPRDLEVEAGAEVELECRAESDERLSVRYTWSLNGASINESNTFRYIGDYKLRLSRVAGRHSGLIECQALTDVDLKIAVMKLAVKDVPSSPRLTSCSCSERKVLLKWDPSNSHGSPIKRYFIEMHTDFERDHWEVKHEEADSNKDIYEKELPLSPWVNYTFRVISENYFGRSDKRPAALDEGESRDNCRCQTRASSPYVNPAGVWAQGDKPDNLIVHWTPMEKIDWNAPHLQYQIRYKLNNPSVAWDEFIVEDPLANNTIIREQPTYKEYLVQVRAVNAIGASINEPEIVKGFSGEDEPTEAPGAFSHGEFLNFSSLNVSWNSVNEKSIHGYFLGYEIEYWPVDDVVIMAEQVIVPRDTQFFLLSGLRPHTNYTAVIRVKNNQYRGPTSNTIHFETPEGVPSAVGALHVSSVGAHSILVEWRPPQRPNGFIRGYFITFTNDQNDTEETYVLHRQTHYLHERAHSDSPYKVAVWAETKAGEGPKTMRPVRTYPIGDPYRPSFLIANLSGGSLDVEWLPREAAGMPGSSFLLNYTLAETGLTNQTFPVFLPNTKIHLDGLKEGSRYVLVAIARDGKRETPSEPYYIDTEAPRDPSKLNQESARTAAWFVSVLLAAAVAVSLLLASSCCLQRRRVYKVGREEEKVGVPPSNSREINDIEEDRKFLEYNYGNAWLGFLFGTFLGFFTFSTLSPVYYSVLRGEPRAWMTTEQHIENITVTTISLMVEDTSEIRAETTATPCPTYPTTIEQILTTTDRAKKWPRVFCMINTMPEKHHTRVKQVNETWARHCDGHVFMTTELNETLTPFWELKFGNATHNTHNYCWIWDRIRTAFTKVYNEKLTDFDWFLKGDDDAFFIIENLKEYLKDKDPEKPYLLGTMLLYNLKGRPKDFVYPSGGAGYVLSKGAVKSFVSVMHDGEKCLNTSYYHEDTEMGWCLYNAGVEVLTSVDTYGRHMMLPIDVSAIVDANNSTRPVDRGWAIQSTQLPFKQSGKTSISNYLADSLESHFGYRPTKGVRIVEFESNDLELNGTKIDADVELWDCSGDEKFNRCWSALLDGTHGVILVANPERHTGESLIPWEREFIERGGIPVDRVLMVLLDSDHTSTNHSAISEFRLPSSLNGVHCVAASLPKDGDNLRLEFNAFLCNVIAEIYQDRHF
ncbi:unnamed protein product, partial [Mesorhabditis belari]|uniref:Neuroglian n=1 Tax=Mesorhabditis belari TaxID=2138241 RepID=A0AAF3FFL3_9BILA